MDDSDFVEKSLKPARELKCKSKDQIISKPMIESDYLLPGGDKDSCFACNKISRMLHWQRDNLKHLDELRKSLHINHCLDQQEARNKYEKKKEDWKKVVDCPICGEPLEPGPFRAAHAKRCGKKHRVDPNSLLLLLDTQAQVAEARKRNGTAHTKLREPKLETKKRFNRLNEEPRSLFDEQIKLVTALSASMCSGGSGQHTETHELPEKLPKFKSEKQQSRSFSLVELEPRSCKCEVIERIQENFLDIFKTRDEGENLQEVLKRNIQDTEEILKNAGVCIRKLNSLQQLADDLANFTKSNGDVIVFSRENETFLACRFIIAARAPTLLQHLCQDGSLKLTEYSGAAIRSYMDFLTSVSITWTENEREEVHSMAIKYGPKGLAALCKSAKLQTSSSKGTVGYHPKIASDGNYGDAARLSNMEKLDEVKGRNCSDAELIVCGGEKDEIGDADLDDPSIVLVEEVERDTNTNDVAKNMNRFFEKTSENFDESTQPEFPNSRGNEYNSRSPDSPHCSLPKCGKFMLDDESEFLEKQDAKHIKPSSSFLDKVDNLDLMGQLNESMESLLRKLSPIKPLSSVDEDCLSPAACFSKQSITDIISGNLEATA